MRENNVIVKVAYVLAVFGAVNWGFLGAVEVNLVQALLGTSVLVNLVYVLMGLSGLLVAYDYFAMGQTRIRKVDTSESESVL